MFVSKRIALSLALCMSTVNAWSTRSFKSVDAVIPEFNITKSREPLAPGYLFLTTIAPPYPAAIIVTDDGEPVWISPRGGYTDLNVQTLNCRSVLTYWDGAGSPNPQFVGHGFGSIHILDHTYTEKHSICPDLGLVADGVTEVKCQADLHELYLTKRGSVFVTGYNLTQADLTSVNGPADGWIYDSLFFEIDIESQEILFEWSALKSGIPISETKLAPKVPGTKAAPLDYFHINSVQPVGSGYLINSRNTWTTYLLNSKGDVDWRFEGSTGGDFSLPSDVNFAWQHQSRVLDITPTSLTLHLFDNANSQPPLSGVNQTQGLIFSLDLEKKTSTLIQDFTDPSEPLYAESQGALALLPNGNVLMGYGQIPVVKEYGPDGQVRMSVQFGDLNGTQSSYRAYRLEWEGVPAADPVVFVEKGTAYISWNGATSVKRWDVYEGSTAHNLKFTHSVKKTGFETEASIKITTHFVKVVAVTRDHGKRHSAVVSVSKVGGNRGQLFL